MAIWPDSVLKERFNSEEYAKLNPASIDLSLSSFLREARWYWQTPLLVRKMLWIALGRPDPFKKENEDIFWSDVKILGTLHNPKEWYWLWPHKLVLLSSQQFIKIPEDAAGLLVSTSSACRAGLNHSHAGWLDPGFKGHLTLEYVTLSQWPIPLYTGLRTIQIVMFSLTDAVELGYSVTGRYQNQGIIPQVPRNEVLSVRSNRGIS